MVTYKSIDKNIVEEFRKKNGLTVREFIEKSKISMTIYYQIINNPEKISVRHIIKLAQFMNVNYQDLFCEKK